MKKLGIILLVVMTCVLLFVACDKPCEHSYGDWQQITAPSCTAKGVEQRTCALCGDVEEREVDALGHDIVNHEAKDATCTEAGHNAYDTCSRCDYTTYAEVKALGHDIKTHEQIDPSYTKVGYEAYEYCSRCDYEGEKKEIAALGFTYRNITLELGELSRYAADGARLKLKLIFANDPEQIVDLVNVEFERYSASIPNGAKQIQLLRYSNNDDTLWEQTDPSELDNNVSALMVKSSGAIVKEEGLNFLYINYNVAGIYQGGERYGVFFYNDEGANTWQQSVLNSDKVARHAIPEGMTKFKVLRTSIVQESISWDSEYWGSLDETVIGDKNYYIFTDYNAGSFLGGFAEWGGKGNVIVEESENYTVSSDSMSEIPVGSTITLTFTASEGYYIGEVKIDGAKVSLTENGTYTLRVLGDINVEVVAIEGQNTDRRITVDLTPVVQGDEIFVVYLYNTDESITDDEWIKATLNGKIASISIPEKYNAFKIARTGPTSADISWDYINTPGNWWGESPAIELQDNSDRYVVTSAGDGHWEGEWSIPLPTNITFDFTAQSEFARGGEQFVIIFFNESEMTTRKVIGIADGFCVKADVQDGETKVYLYRVALDVDTSVDGYGYGGWGQTYELTLVGGKDTFVVSGAEGDKFVGSWN